MPDQTMPDPSIPKQPTGLYSLANLKRLAYILDDRFKIPFTRYRLGWDFIIGLIPVAGDILTAIVSFHILIAARKYGVSGGAMWKMLSNILIDMVVGSVPLVGDLLDASWKANAMNVKLLVKSIEDKQDIVLDITEQP